LSGIRTHEQYERLRERLRAFPDLRCGQRRARGWVAPVRFLDDGRYPVDNNACENAIRPFVIGRSNWMFSDSVAGAQASANLYSLIETALCRMRHSAVHAERRTMPKRSSQSFVVADLQLVDSA